MQVQAGSAVPAPAAAADPVHGAPGARASRHRVEFTASGEEYFRIWIVNLALTIVTLGIYSAWAKVRTKRYFYGHTLVDGEAFEYRGDPVAILKGRIIAVVLLVLYSLAGALFPPAQPVFAIAGAVVLPWLVVRSLAFNAFNSAYRNVRFRFRGRYGEAFRVLVVNGILVSLSLGLLYPYFQARLARLVFSRHCYGATPFELPALNADFYRIYFKALALVFGVFALGLLVLAAAVSIGGMAAAAGLVMFAAALGLGWLLAYASIRARVANLTWNRARLGKVRFECTMKTGELFAVYLVNILTVVATFGLAVPWAKVRTWRYRCRRMTIVAGEGLDHFLAAESADVGATGEAMGDLFAVDIGF